MDGVAVFGDGRQWSKVSFSEKTSGSLSQKAEQPHGTVYRGEGLCEKRKTKGS